LTQEELNKLNEKLLDWVGIDNFLERSGLKFYLSLDDCFKKLVPKAISQITKTFKVNIKSAWQILFSLWYQGICDVPNNHTLALCLAIEKLIDAEDKNV